MKPTFIGLSQERPAGSEEQGGGVDYAYVFGSWHTTERHDPHLHQQETLADSDFRDIADFIRGGTPAP